jgi:uncharacterized membrane protein YoaK (UPF0700 family)
MAVQNSLLQLSRKFSPPTAVMTDNLIVSTLALWAVVRRDADEAAQWERFKKTWPLLAGFILSCFSGAVGVQTCGKFAWIAPALISLAALLMPNLPSGMSSVSGIGGRI